MSCEIGNAITSWFAALARDALKPLLTLAGETLLSSPQAGAIPAVHAMWTTSLAIADSAYVLLAVIGGVIVMGHETLQTSYSAKDITPRLVTGFLCWPAGRPPGCRSRPSPQPPSIFCARATRRSWPRWKPPGIPVPGRTRAAGR